MSNGTVLVHRTMSLDGYIAGPEHEMDWIFEHAAPEGARDVMLATGAIVAGRNTYGVGERDTGKPTEAPYGGAWSGPIFVLTHQQLDVPDGVTVISGDIRDVVATAKAAASGKTVELFGANVAAQAFQAGLVDEVLVHVAPVLLGEGIAFSPGSGRVDLELIETTRTGGLMSLRYRVRRSR
jgi:dihydrofolate reductase